MSRRFLVTATPFATVLAAGLLGAGAAIYRRARQAHASRGGAVVNSASVGFHFFSRRSLACAQSITASLVRPASIVLAIGFSTLPALAQTSASGAIRGHVKDSTGAVLRDTTITAVSATAPAPLSVVSDSEGYYRLLELPPGEYELTAERAGFARFVRPGIAVRAGLNLAVDIDMVLGGQTDTVSVKADTPMLESSTAVQAINIGGEFQRDLPSPVVATGRTRWDWRPASCRRRTAPARCSTTCMGRTSARSSCRWTVRTWRRRCRTRMATST